MCESVEYDTLDWHEWPMGGTRAIPVLPDQPVVHEHEVGLLDEEILPLMGD
ncbi:MAG: hypothetical protein ACTIDN_09655 [Acetobacter sp.]|uniref:hypothetical protein n=1 Tax=Acetobacter sp. TaxID=440 RepID=UPI003F9251F6